MPESSIVDCELCKGGGGELLWKDSFCRVVGVDEPGFPGFCRVILGAHVREMTDLDGPDRERLMKVVLCVEEELRRLFEPDKMNLASLGNLTPHVHWHVIPRFAGDSHFPRPIWTEPVRPANPRSIPGDWKARLARELSGRLGSVS